MRAYSYDVRVVFKQLPLEAHADARLAAEASLAAQAQKKFWDYARKLYANQSALDRASLEKYAQELGLHLERFRSDLDSHKWKERVDAESADGARFGVRDVPAFFVDGKRLAGEPTFAAFKAMIDPEVDAADQKAKRGLAGDAIYDDLMETAHPGTPPAEKPRAR